MDGDASPGPGSKRRLIAFLERELEDPRPFETLAREIPDLLPGERHLGSALAALAEADRKRFWVKSQPLWFSRFGWRLIRPMMTTGLIAVVLYYFFGSEKLGGELLFFLFGVAALYVVLQIYAHFWSGRDDKKLDQAERELAERLGHILEELNSGPRR